MATAAVSGPASLYALRLLLGVAEAATLPGCFALMARFNTPATMAVAYPAMLTFTLTSSVIGGPLGAALLSMHGVGGQPGWRWVFLLEGAATVALAACLPCLVPETVGAASWLTPAEKEAAAAGLVSAARGAGVPPPETGVAAHDGPASDHLPLLPTLAVAFRILRVPQIWALGGPVVLSQFAFWIVLYFTPLELFSAFGGGAPPSTDPRAVARTAVDAALKSAIVFLPAAAALVAAGAVVKRTGDRKWVAFATLAASGAAFAALPSAAASGGPGAGLALLTLAAAGGTGSMGALSTWPHRYLAASGRSQAAAFAAFNSFSSVAGALGPFMAGAMPRETAFYVVAAFQFAAAALLLAFGCWEDGGPGSRRAREEKEARRLAQGLEMSSA
jgi:MFS family permease